ncbi:MAG: hypothetical protein AB8B61_10445 [Cyclobacteriaceae bacterium]
MKRTLVLFIIIQPVLVCRAETSVLDSTVVSLFEIAKKQVIEGKYSIANQTFLTLMRPNKLMPDELTYYFGKSLYHTKYPAKATAFLEKYLELKGDSATFYKETLSMLKALGHPVIEPQDTVYKEKTKEQIELVKCMESESVVCPVCKGSHTLTSSASFGAAFRVCNYCDERGLMPCEHYKRFVEEGVLLEYTEE